MHRPSSRRGPSPSCGAVAALAPVWAAPSLAPRAVHHALPLRLCSAAGLLAALGLRRGRGCGLPTLSVAPALPLLPPPEPVLHWHSPLAGGARTARAPTCILQHIVHAPFLCRAPVASLLVVAAPLFVLTCSRRLLSAHGRRLVPCDLAALAYYVLFEHTSPLLFFILICFGLWACVCIFEFVRAAMCFNLRGCGVVPCRCATAAAHIVSR